MKLTWFGGTTLRIHIGGEIVVVDPEGAPSGVDRNELLGGASKVITLGENEAPLVDADRWRPRPPARSIDAARPLECLSIGRGTLLIDGPGEPPLLIIDTAKLPHLGRWVDGAVFVLFGREGARTTETIVELDLARPRLFALAAETETLDQLVERLDALIERQDEYDSSLNLASLEPGLALEV